jgi:hypothetical protein
LKAPPIGSRAAAHRGGVTAAVGEAPRAEAGCGGRRASEEGGGAGGVEEGCSQLGKRSDTLLLYAYADLEGNWKFADQTLFEGLAEVAKKRFNLASYRQMAQADPNPCI